MSAVELNAPMARVIETSSPAVAAHGSINRTVHAAFAVCAVLYVTLYASTFASLARTWAHSGTFEYAFFIFPICLVLAWMRRNRLRHTVAIPRLLGVAPVAMLCLCWLAARLADVRLVEHAAVVALVPALVFSFYGAGVTRALAFPLAYLAFAVPFGNFMVGPLQDITAHLSTWALRLTDVPVYMEGRVILTPASAWHVAAACSGVKFFVATTAFGALYANLFFQRWRRRVVFVACAMIVPIAANGLRVFFTILIGEYAGLQYATGTDHMIFGWQFFGTVLVLLFFAGWPWHEAEPVAGVAPAAAPRQSADAGPGRIVLVGLLCAACLALAPLQWWQMRSAVQPGAPASTELPATLEGMTRDPAAAAGIDAGTAFAAAGQHRTAFYGTGDTAVRLDWAWAPAMSGVDDGELVTYGNRVYDEARWRVRSDAGPSSTPRVGTSKIVETRNADSALRLWYVYRVNGRLTRSALSVKAWQVVYAMLGRPVDSAIVVLSTPEDAGAGARLADAVPTALDVLAGRRKSVR